MWVCVGGGVSVDERWVSAVSDVMVMKEWQLYKCGDWG